MGLVTLFAGVEECARDACGAPGIVCAWQEILWGVLTSAHKCSWVHIMLQLPPCRKAYNAIAPVLRCLADQQCVITAALYYSAVVLQDSTAGKLLLASAGRI